MTAEYAASEKILPLAAGIFGDLRTVRSDQKNARDHERAEPSSQQELLRRSVAHDLGKDIAA